MHSRRPKRSNRDSWLVRRATYRNSKVSVVDGPPAVEKLIVCTRCSVTGSRHIPRLVLSDEVNHADSCLVEAIRGLVLVVGARSTVVDEAQTVPVLVFVVLIQKALIGAIKTVTGSSECLQCPVVAHVWCEDHDARVEGIGPADVGCAGERCLNIEKLVGCAQCNDVGVEVNDLSELRLAPKIHFGKGKEQISSVHKIQVGGTRVADAFDGDDIVV